MFKKSVMLECWVVDGIRPGFALFIHTLKFRVYPYLGQLFTPKREDFLSLVLWYIATRSNVKYAWDSIYVFFIVIQAKMET